MMQIFQHQLGGLESMSAASHDGSSGRPADIANEPPPMENRGFAAVMLREECRRRQGAAFLERQMSRSSSKGSKTKGRRLSATMSMGNGIPLQLDSPPEPSTRRSSNAMKHSISRRGSL